MNSQHKVKELAFDLQQVYYKAFQEHLLAEPLSLNTVSIYLSKVELELFLLEKSKVANIIYYSVIPSYLLSFLEEHQSLSEYELRVLTLSIKSVVEGDSVIRVMLCSSTPQLDGLTLVMLDAAPEFMEPRKRFSQVTPEQLAAADYKPIIQTLWTKSFYSQSEVGRLENYRINFEWINSTFFQARACFGYNSDGRQCWVNYHADTIEELEKKVSNLYRTFSYRTPSQSYVKSWKNKLLLIDS